MGRPKGGINKNHAKEEKLKIVLDCINNGLSSREASKKYDVSNSQISKWTKQYLEDGEDALENKKKTGNITAAIHSSKKLTDIERLKLENLRLRIENERLKKGYTEKEVKEAHAGLSKKNLK